MLFEDSEYNGYHSSRFSAEIPLYKSFNDKQNKLFRDFQIRYSFYTIHNITLLLVGSKIYIFKIKELAAKMFPDSHVSFTDKNFANLDTYFLLDISSKSNPNGEDFQGVKEYFGEEILPAKFEKNSYLCRCNFG